MAVLDVRQTQLLKQAKLFFVNHDGAVGVLIPPIGEAPIFLKSGINGGPWGGTHRGGIPRGNGWAFTQGGPSQGNIATHVEGHAVAILWQRGFKNAVLLVDRPMCKVCERDLPQTMMKGMEMTVISEEEGITVVRSSHGS